MAEITDRESLEAWLKTRPREDAVVIAARAALRAAPFLVNATAHGAMDPLATIVLPSASSAFAAGRAAASWIAVEHDVGQLAKGQRPSALAAAALWPAGQPPDAAEAWAALRARLLDADPGWQVWTEWYQDRLDGKPFDKALEEARVLIPEQLWQQGPKALNAEIARLIEEHGSSLRRSAARRISQQPKAAAKNADRERVKLEQRIEELRASLPNDPDGLEEATREIAELEAMKRSLETVVAEATALPEDARPEDAEKAGEAVEDLAAQLKNWVNGYLTKERADAAADAVVLAGLAGLLIWFGMPAWLAGSYLIARFNGHDVIEKLKAIIRRPD